jgi:hypothetical protein
MKKSGGIEAGQEGGDITISPGVNPELVPFCTIEVDGKHYGQLSPNQVRQFALGWLKAAEAAESDAIVLRALTKDMDLPMHMAGAFVVNLRQHRIDAQTDSDARHAGTMETRME